MNEQSTDPLVPEKAGNRPQRQRYRPTALQRLLVLLAVAAGVVLGAVGWAAATENSPAPQPSASTSLSEADNPGWAYWEGPWAGPWGARWRGTLFDRGRALHGEVVLATDRGGTETLVIQRGELTAVTSTSITVTSSDSFHHTYVTNDHTVIDGGREPTRPLRNGTDVVVSARKNGSTLTAIHIIHLAD